LYADAFYGAAIRGVEAQVIAIAAASQPQTAVPVRTTETCIQRYLLNFPFEVLAEKFGKTIIEFMHSPAKVQT
jgi:hypothetical protein